MKFELPQPVDDGQLIPEVGEHSKDKHYFLQRYIYAFTTGMKTAVKNKKWTGLHYLDLFAGAGIERLEKSKCLCWGSPLIAAQTETPFQGLHFCELDRKKYEPLLNRIGQLPNTPQIQTLCGDANEKINEIVATVPQGSLSLAFLDPYGLHLDYKTLQVLSNIRCDLIIFFPDRVDVLRNWKLNYHDDPESNLDQVLGPQANWRSIFQNEPQTQWAFKLREMYVEQIRKLGYIEFEYERISSKGRPIYQLIFCSKHSLGGKYWRGVAKRKPDAQNTFDFGSPS